MDGRAELQFGMAIACGRTRREVGLCKTWGKVWELWEREMLLFCQSSFSTIWVMTKMNLRKL